ncbi:MAG: radical SAM protein [Acutalibacteraceae bacterium]
MKLISSFNEILSKVIGPQSIDPDSKYRLANYTFKVSYNGNMLLYNNISKKLYLLNNDEIAALDNLREPDFELLKPLLLDWTLVKDDFNDTAFSDQARWLYSAYFRKFERPNFIIFTTTKCNARCYYCFEHGQTRIDMSEKTAEDVADYIIKNAPDKKVYIKWFGGEPLYNEKVIDIICGRLQAAGVKYDTNITTNGYLFDEKMIEKAVSKWNLHSAVITLDGTEDKYNKIKNYIYQTGNPFQRVISNIAQLIDNGIRVAIRLNISLENYEDIKQLIIYLKDRFHANEMLSIIPIALYDLDGTRSENEHRLFDGIIEEIEKMVSEDKYRKNNLKVFSDLGTRCMAELDSCKLISPIGQLGTCEHFSEGEMMYGSIYSDEENSEIKNYFKHREVLDICYTCPLYANCGGMGRCPSQTRKCCPEVQKNRLRSLYNAIIATYEQYLNNGEITITQ